jgi:hypothetical protein
MAGELSGGMKHVHSNEGNTLEEKVSKGNRAPKNTAKFPHTERGLSMYWHLNCRQVIYIFIWMEAFAGS